MDHKVNDHPFESFAKSFSAAFIGYWLGSKLDQTRFGIWFNTNRTINVIFTALVTAFKIIVVVLALYFIVLVAQQFMS